MSEIAIFQQFTEPGEARASFPEMPCERLKSVLDRTIEEGGTMRWLLAAGLFASMMIGMWAQSDGLAEARQQMNDAAAKGDKVAYGQFLSEDVTWIDRAGRVRNKTAILADLQPQTGPTARSTPEVRSYGNSVLVVGKRSNADGVEVAFIEAWVKTGNQWQLVSEGEIPASRNNRGSPATKPSSKLPPSMGLQADRDAVQKNNEAIDTSNVKGDATMFKDAVTAQYVTLRTDADPLNRETRAQQIAKAGPRPAGIKPVEGSTRIHGTMAVTKTQRLPPNTPGGGITGEWRMIVTVKENGEWRRAAIIGTPITGAAIPITQ